MAEFQISYNVTVTATVKCSDSKLKDILTGDIDLSECLTLQFESHDKLTKSVGFDDVEMEFEYPDFWDIEKSNGNCYNWDGENLTKNVWL